MRILLKLCNYIILLLNYFFGYYPPNDECPDDPKLLKKPVDFAGDVVVVDVVDVVLWESDVDVP